MALVLTLFLAELVVAAALQDSRNALGLSRGAFDAFITLFGNGIVFVVLMDRKQMSYGDLFHPTRSSASATIFLLTPLIALLVPALVLSLKEVTDFIEVFFPLSQAEIDLFERMASNDLGGIVATGLLAPVLEEMLFRGIILRAFLQQYSRTNAIYGSAIIFGMAHGNIYQFVVAFFLGSIQGWLYERTRSLFPCIALHAFYNCSCLAVGMLDRADGGNRPWSASPMTWLFAFAFASMATIALRRLLYRPPIRTAG